MPPYTWAEIPNDWWLMIISNLDGYELEPLSLVCKSFLSIINNQKRSLKVINPNVQVLSQLFRRFPRIEEICLNSRDYFKVNFIESDKLLGCSMRNLKTFICSNIEVDDNILDHIGNSFPLLEELTIKDYCHGITDDGFVVLVSRLKNLKKIYLWGPLSDISIIALSCNCALLTEVRVISDHITVYAIGFLICISPNLVSLLVNFAFGMYPTLPLLTSFGFENTIGYARKLEDIEIWRARVNDNFVSPIANAQLPLKKIALSSQRCSISGLSLLLHTYNSITSLSIEFPPFPNVNSFKTMLEDLHHLTCIRLVKYNDLTNSCCVLLLKICRRLKSIELERCKLGKGDFDVESIGNTKIQRLCLTTNIHLNDTTLESIGRVCPNLQHLKIERSLLVTRKGITGILKRCSKLKVLELNNYKDTSIFEDEVEVPEVILAEIYLSRSKIDEEGLLMIGKKCHRLGRLVLQSCKDITEDAVRKMAANSPAVKITNMPR